MLCALAQNDLFVVVKMYTLLGPFCSPMMTVPVQEPGQRYVSAVLQAFIKPYFTL